MLAWFGGIEVDLREVKLVPGKAVPARRLRWDRYQDTAELARRIRAEDPRWRCLRPDAWTGQPGCARVDGHGNGAFWWDSGRCEGGRQGPTCHR